MMTEKKESVVVFDFDQTLTTAHMFHLIGGGHKLVWHDGTLTRERILDNKEFIVDGIFGGEKRLAELKRRLSLLFLESDLVISSNNYLTHIKRALEKVDLLSYFSWIHARNEFYSAVAENLSTGEIIGGVGRKQDFIGVYLQPEYRCVVFIDDEMLDAYYFYFSPQKNVHLLAMRKGQKGIDANDFNRIEKAIADCKRNNALLSSGLSKIVLCLQCKEREACFYSEKRNASFCDPYCERENNSTI